MARQRLDAFTSAYIEAALWSTNDESDESGGEPLDKNYDASDIAEKSMRRIISDCASFQERYGHLIYDDDSPAISKYGADEMAGHDFWLTRNGHGSGFWDGNWPKHGEELTAAAEEYGNVDIVVGDDGELHFEGGRQPQGTFANEAPRGRGRQGVEQFVLSKLGHTKTMREGSPSSGLTLGKPERHRAGFGARQHTVERTPVYNSAGKEIGAVQRRFTKNRAIDSMTTHHASRAGVRGYDLAWLGRQEDAVQSGDWQRRTDQ